MGNQQLDHPAVPLKDGFGRSLAAVLLPRESHSRTTSCTRLPREQYGSALQLEVSSLSSSPASRRTSLLSFRQPLEYSSTGSSFLDTSFTLDVESVRSKPTVSLVYILQGIWSFKQYYRTTTYMYKQLFASNNKILTFKKKVIIGRQQYCCGLALLNQCKQRVHIYTFPDQN